MRLPIPYKQINKLAEQETFESTFTWGLRMAISATAPIVWGAATGHITEAVWISLTAEGICFMELRGSFNQGLRVLIAGALIAFLFSVLGSITGTSLVLSVAGMLLVGFLAGLFKNLGDRGSNLAVAAFVLFIVCNAYPTHSTEELWLRVLLILTGGIWSIIVGMIVTITMPAQEPYRRTVGLIWKSIASLTSVVSNGWDGKTLRASTRDIYLKEQAVRFAIDNSLHYYETTSQQTTTDESENRLVQIRKATALVAAHIDGISEELETVSIKETETGLQLKLYDVLRCTQQLAERIGVFIITLKPEDELLLTSRINRLKHFISALKEYPLQDEKIQTTINRICQLSERSLKLVDNIVIRLDEMGEDKPVFRSYSLFKTLFILHPKHWIKNLSLLFNFNTFTTKYALRTAIAAAVAMFISKWFHVDHGYWIPFTVLIISQPYFGATLKKAFDRIIGTVLGGIAAGLILRIQAGVWVEIILLFFSLVLMIYYLRNRYSVGAFFITIALILLFHIEMPISESLIYTRAFSTIGGAAIAIAAGFALLPHNDKRTLPLFTAKAIAYNYEYFFHTFFSEHISGSWTKHKRIAESNNSNAFDSFTRFIREPGTRKKQYAIYYQILTHNVRITRELNNINMERDNNTGTNTELVAPDQRLEICMYWFKQNLYVIKHISPEHVPSRQLDKFEPNNVFLSPEQIVYTDRMIMELKSMHQDLLKLKTRDIEPEH